MKLPVPVNVVTGALGVGKTTSLAQLLKQKPADEHWAVLINEFGAVGIDAALLEGSQPVEQSAGTGYTVHELAGGCMCCTLSGPVGAALAQLVRRVKPDRLLIEPSGLGHPAGLLDLLMGEHLRTALDVKTVICLVDPRQVSDPSSPFHQHDVFTDQVNIADILVANKTDLASIAELQDFHTWAQQLYPAKLRVQESVQGRIPLALLDVARTAVCTPDQTATSQPQTLSGTTSQTGSQRDPVPSLTALVMHHQPDSQRNAAPAPKRGEGAHDHSAHEAAAELQRLQLDTQLRPGQPVRQTGRNGSQFTCGWIFSREDVFDRRRLLGMLADLQPYVDRAKGVFRVGKDWMKPCTTSEGQMALEAIAYRRDSRIEVIVTKSAQPAPGSVQGLPDVAQAARTQDWHALEAHLLSLLIVQT